MAEGVGARRPGKRAGRLWRHAMAYYRASRPFSLPASVVPVLVGSALAFLHGEFSLPRFLLVLIASVLVQVGTNLVDEYADHTSTRDRGKLLAPYKVIALGHLSARAVKAGAVAAYGMAGVLGAAIVLLSGWPILVACLASLAAASFYAGGPRPLGSLGLGPPLVFLFMGPVMVMGTNYVYTQELTLGAFLLSLPVGFLVTAILVANDVRDLEEDRQVGKTSVVTLWGRGVGRALWSGLVAGAYGAVLALVVGTGSAALLLTLLALPPAASAARALWQSQSRAELALAVRRTAALHLHFGLLLALGLGLGRFLSF